MRTRRTVAAAAAMTGLLALGACSSSHNGGSAGPGAAATSAAATSTVASGAPIKLGVVTSLTGDAASSFTTVEAGVKARIDLQNAQGGVQGHKLEYIMADDASSGPGAVAAVQKLIEQDGVYGILDDSSFFSAAAATTTRAGIPVSGAGFDGGPEWLDKSATNLFDTYGYADYNLVASTYGAFFKAQGGTRVFAVGYDGAPNSALTAEAGAASAEHAGLAATYDNSLAFGSTDVGPLVQKIKAFKADVVYTATVQSTSYALATAIKQAGVKLKMLVLDNGYGPDVINDPATANAATGVYFMLNQAPLETGNAGTTQLVSALKTYADAGGEPSFGAYIGWLTADLMIYGLEKAGPGASTQQFIAKLRASTWNGGDGIMSPTNFTDVKPAAAGLDQADCAWVARFDGSKFVMVQGASPVCGSIVPGLTVK
jgi:branched-chain amino acid transport system substrate-binding protein